MSTTAEKFSSVPLTMPKCLSFRVSVANVFITNTNDYRKRQALLPNARSKDMLLIVYIFVNLYDVKANYSNP